MSSAKSASGSIQRARGYKATTTQEKSEPNRLSGRRRRRKKNGWRSRNQKRLENSEAPNMYIFVVWIL